MFQPLVSAYQVYDGLGVTRDAKSTNRDAQYRRNSGNPRLVLEPYGCTEHEVL